MGGSLDVCLRASPEQDHFTCRSRAEIGIPATPDESFVLDDDDTVFSVQQAHRAAFLGPVSRDMRHCFRRPWSLARSDGQRRPVTDKNVVDDGEHIALRVINSY
ncbi:MAG TPA: hypothetical protein VIJ07_17945 [Dermatophilaceae bacterium]